MTNNNENVEAPYYWPFAREYTGERKIPVTKASNAEGVSLWSVQQTNIGIV